MTIFTDIKIVIELLFNLEYRERYDEKKKIKKIQTTMFTRNSRKKNSRGKAI